MEDRRTEQIEKIRKIVGDLERSDIDLDDPINLLDYHGSSLATRASDRIQQAINILKSL